MTIVHYVSKDIISGNDMKSDCYQKPCCYKICRDIDQQPSSLVMGRTCKHANLLNVKALPLSSNPITRYDRECNIRIQCLGIGCRVSMGSLELTKDME